MKIPHPDLSLKNFGGNEKILKAQATYKYDNRPASKVTKDKWHIGFKILRLSDSQLRIL